MSRAPQLTRRDIAAASALTVVADRSLPYRAAGQAFARVEASLSALSRAREADAAQRQAQADQEAKAARVRQAQKDGAVAGTKMQNLTLLPDDTDENRAHNAAASRSYFRSLELEMRSGLDELAAQYAHDPDMMAQKMTAYSAGFTSRVPEYLQQDAQILALDTAQPYIFEAQRQKRQAVIAQDKADFSSQMDLRAKGLIRTAALSDIGPDGDMQIARGSAAVKDLLVQYGPKTAFEFDGVKYDANPARAGLIGVDGMAAQWQDLQGEVQMARITGGFDRLDSEGEKRAYAERLAQDYEAGTGLAGNLSPDQYSRVQNGFDRQLKSYEVERRARGREAKSEIRDIRALYASGFVPAPGALEEVRIQAYSSGDPEAIAAFREMQSFGTFMEGLSSARPAQVKAFIEAGRGQKQTPESAARVQAAEQFLPKLERELKEDPLGWAARQGMAVTPFDFSADFAPQLAARAREAEAVADEYGLNAPVYLRPDEIAGFSDFAQDSPDNMVQLIGVFAGAGDAGRDMLRQIAPKDPQLGHLAGLGMAGGEPAFISDAARGIAMARDPGYKSRKPSRMDMGEVIKGSYGNAFAYMPGSAQPMAIMAAENAYEARAFRDGKVPGDTVDKDLMDKALQEAAGARFDGPKQYGGIGQVRDVDIIVPNWIEPDRVDKVLDWMGDFQWKKAGVYGPPVDADGKPLTQKDLQDAKLVSIGHGRYRVLLNDPDSVAPFYAGAGNGDKLYVLDLNRIEADVRADKNLSKYTYGGGQ